MDVNSIYDQNVLIALEKTCKLDMLTDASDWQLNSEIGELSFENGMKFPIQYISTESYDSNTWLWADANVKMNFPEASLTTVRRIRQAGKELGIEEFASDQFSVSDELHSSKFVVASDYLGNVDASIACSHDHGAVHVALFDPNIIQQPDIDSETLREFVSQLMWLEGDLFERISAYLIHKKYIDKKPENDQIQCVLSSGEPFAASMVPTSDGGTQIQMDFAEESEEV